MTYEEIKHKLPVSNIVILIEYHFTNRFGTKSAGPLKVVDKKPKVDRDGK